MGCLLWFSLCTSCSVSAFLSCKDAINSVWTLKSIDLFLRVQLKEVAFSDCWICFIFLFYLFILFFFFFEGAKKYKQLFSSWLRMTATMEQLSEWPKLLVWMWPRFKTHLCNRQDNLEQVAVLLNSCSQKTANNPRGHWIVIAKKQLPSCEQQNNRKAILQNPKLFSSWTITSWQFIKDKNAGFKHFCQFLCWL